jgi:glutathionyl-hydroquinone reductase
VTPPVAVLDLETMRWSRRSVPVLKADWRLFTTLTRFDAVYHAHFKCNRTRIADFSELWDYTRTLYQIPGIAETVHLDQMRRSINDQGVTPPKN